PAWPLRKHFDGKCSSYLTRVPPLRGHLKGHIVIEARERGWDRLANGDLLQGAEAAGFDVFVTADKNLRYQQNLSARKLAIVVIGNAQWRVLRLHVERVV